MEAAEAERLVQRLREQRLTTLSLAEQIKDDRWHEPALPGAVTVHETLAHLLAWDEWAVAVFEISLIRDELPPVLQRALDDVDGFNQRARTRHRGISRFDLLNGLQTANPRLITSAQASGGPEWHNRAIAGLRYPADWQMSQEPNVGGILRMLRAHESAHDKEIMAAFGIEPKLDEWRDQQGANAGGERRSAASTASANGESDEGAAPSPLG
jgi:hypothetical protein